MTHRSRQTLAHLVRRVPYLMLVAYYVYRFFQPKYTIGVVGILWNNQNQVLLVEHVFHPKLPWGLPGGWIGFNEDPAHAVARELREELQLSVKTCELIHMRKTQYLHLDLAFVCTTDSAIGTLSHELLGYQWVSVSALPRLHSFHYEAILRSQPTSGAI